jgi:hypothetical protein
MARTKPIGGYADVRFNDQVLLFRGDMTYNFQVFQKTGVRGRDSRFHGHTVAPQVPFIEMEISWDGSVTTKQLEAAMDATVSCTLADGRQLVLRGAYVAGEINPNVDEAKCKLRWEGDIAGDPAAPGGRSDAARSALEDLRSTVLQAISVAGANKAKLVPYAVARPKPSRSLAQLFYGDDVDVVARAAELVARTGSIHPAFLPARAERLSQ